MKRYDNSYGPNNDKRKAQEWKREHKGGGFRCYHCKRFVVINGSMGTANRNHCNLCLWSKHVDINKGDRLATCQGGMEPIGLTLKHEGCGKVGEIMLIHLCCSCKKISINRIAADDLEYQIISVFKQSFDLDGSIKNRLHNSGIYLLCEKDDKDVHTQLFGDINR
jgi:hypothetical protein